MGAEHWRTFAMPIMSRLSLIFIACFEMRMLRGGMSYACFAEMLAEPRLAERTISADVFAPIWSVRWSTSVKHFTGHQHDAAGHMKRGGALAKNLHFLVMSSRTILRKEHDC